MYKRMRLFRMASAGGLVGLLLCLLANGCYAHARTPGVGAIASAHPLATQAGEEILRVGGNAFDVAVAVSAALAVVEPYSSGIGGGGFFLLHRASDGFEIMLDAREKAPLSATRDMYLDDQGLPQDALSKQGPLAAGIPGLPAGIVHLAKQYGRLPLQVTLAAAIRYARQGFKVTPHYQKMAGMRKATLLSDATSSGLFLQDGEVPKLGYRLRQVDLAATLSAIAEQGAAGFYAGAVAEKLLAGVQAAGGIWQAKDLADYRVVERKPLYAEYRGMKIVSAPPPSSGGVALIEIFNILANFERVQQDVAGKHVLIESMRRAYRDRALYLGDPDFVSVPVARLTHPLYAAGLAASISGRKATPSALLPGIEAPAVGTDTTHFSVIDRDGNRVAATLSINFPFGACFVPPGTGVVLNDEMDDFSVKPGVPNGYGLVGAQDANAIAPGKRMLSSMTPTFLETQDRLAILGTPGGSRIITMVLLAALQFYQAGSAESMVTLPRLHHQFLPDVVSYEPGALAEADIQALQALGHELKETPYRYGNMQVVVWDKKQNSLTAAADPRAEGQAVVAVKSK